MILNKLIDLYKKDERIKFIVKLLVVIPLFYYTYWNMDTQIHECRHWNGYMRVGICLCPPEYSDMLLITNTNFSFNFVNTTMKIEPFINKTNISK